MLLSEFFQMIRPLDSKAGAMDAFGRVGAFCGEVRLPYMPEGYVGPVDVQPPLPAPLGMRRPQDWWSPEAEPNLAAEFLLFLGHLTENGGAIRDRALSLSSGTGFAKQAENWREFLAGVSERFLETIEEWRSDF